ncbi:NUDIX hydrolase [Streptomyces sp. NRRL S-337]|uniref:NUDIX hydrolase n=1 Tax=Streptomyces sp. NRRL S-337 TaxID=1463900 RepID=UPI000A40526B|nr:NUDIX hydrolase [Streptomyces sp. NRRL S-337]
MPPSPSLIRKAVEAYLNRHPDERDAVAELLAALDRPVDATARTTLPGHVTCSAVVIDRERRVLHIRHRATGGRMLVPGGHIEPADRTLLAAALREVSEEAGIPPGALCLTRQTLGSPIDIDVHDIDANLSKGEPAHRHYDFRYVFYLADEEPPAITLQDEEVSGARWTPMSEVASPMLRAKLLRAQLDGQPDPVNASVLVHDGQGRYLLHLRDHMPGIAQPGAFALLGGGRNHDDQSLEGTLLRELSEEVPGLRLENLAPYAVVTATSVHGLSVPVQVFAGRWRGNPDRLRLQEGVLLRWFTPDQLDRLRLSPATADLIHRHASVNTPDGRPAEAAPPWDGGARTVLNGIGVHLHLQDDEGRVLLGLRHPNSRYAGDTWHYLAGRCEQESAMTTPARFDASTVTYNCWDITRPGGSSWPRADASSCRSRSAATPGRSPSSSAAGRGTPAASPTAPTEGLEEALRGPRHEVVTGVTIEAGAYFGSLHLYAATPCSPSAGRPRTRTRASPVSQRTVTHRPSSATPRWPT